MIVTQQLYSTDGFFKQKSILVNSIYKKDGVILSFTKHKSVIFVNKKEYPIVFRNSSLRDEAFDIITKGLNENRELLVLDLELFYTHTLSNDNIQKEIKAKEYKFNKHLLKCAEYILSLDNTRTTNYLLKTDAFKSLSVSQLKKFVKGESINFNNEQLKTFSKTLRYPKEFHDYVSPYDFWVNLYQLRASSSSSSSRLSAPS